MRIAGLMGSYPILFTPDGGRSLHNLLQEQINLIVGSPPLSYALSLGPGKIQSASVPKSRPTVFHQARGLSISARKPT